MKSFIVMKGCMEMSNAVLYLARAMINVSEPKQLKFPTVWALDVQCWNNSTLSLGFTECSSLLTLLMGTVSQLSCHFIHTDGAVYEFPKCEVVWP